MFRSRMKFSLTSKLKYSLGAALLLLSFVLYIYGISAPILRIKGGDPGPFVAEARQYDFSMPRLLHLLLDQGDYVPFLCIFTFSFVIPLLKFAFITASLVASACCRQWPYSGSFPLKIATVLRVLAKYQLVDVFSTIILTGFIDFVGISAEPLFAARAYQAYSLLSIITIQWLCYCYSETLERSKLTECCRRAHLALRSPLLPRGIPVSANITLNGCTAPMDSSSEGPTALSSRRLPALISLASVEDLQSSRFHCCSQGVQQRASHYSHASLPHNSYPSAANTTAEFSGYFSSADTQPANVGFKKVPVGSDGDVDAVEKRDSCRLVRAADVTTSIMAFPRDPCLRSGRFLDELPHALPRIPEAAVPDELELLLGAALLGSTYPRCSFSECLLRMFFLACSFCISAFAAFICWVRPVMNVSLVPGKQRGFAVETSVMSLGDVFWKLYSMGHQWNDCIIIAVFPLLAALVLYVASIGTMASACLAYWAARGSEQLPASTMPERASQTSPSSTMNIAQKAMHVMKALSNISAFLGDIAMPDVQSIAVLACYFIANSIDFLGARLPGTPLGQPSCTPERLLWNFSGFWAMMALGLSASQVQRFAISFDDVCRDMRALFHNEAAKDHFFPSSLLVANAGSPRTMLGGGRSSIRDGWLDDGAVAYSPVLTMPKENSSITTRSRRRRSPSFGLILHGCIRLAVSVALLLPIWLRPTEIVDVDLGIVNKQLQGFMEYVNPLLRNMLPQSFGDCASATHVAPPPCAGSMPLAYVRTNVYEATARWATGLNSTELHAARFDASKSRIVFTITGKIKSLSLSLRIGGCFYGEDPGKCPVLWDGADACCGDDIKFMLQMSVRCNNSFPYLSDATFLHTHISRLVVKEKILGIFPVEVADITQTVEDQLSQWARTFLDPERKWIHWRDGATLSVINLLNVLLNLNAPAGIRCPRV